MKLMMGAISFQQLSNWHDACISNSEIAGDGSPKPEYVAYHHLSHRRFLAMTTFLHIDFSPLFGRSVSRQLTSPFVTRWKSSHPDGMAVDRDQVVTLRRIVLHRAVDWWAVAALGVLRAVGADIARGGTIQHPCFPLDSCASQHTPGAADLCDVGAGLLAIPR
jgi:hypothetical protein